jgi:L-rhamnose isomerase/sugar isomerase
MIDQSHNIEGKMLPMILSVLNCQEAYAKSLIVPRKTWRDAQANGDVVGAHEILNNAYKTDVRPLLVQVREELGVPTNPIAAYRASGYEEKIARERGTAQQTGGYQS